MILISKFIQKTDFSASSSRSKCYPKKFLAVEVPFVKNQVNWTFPAKLVMRSGQWTDSQTLTDLG